VSVVHWIHGTTDYPIDSSNLGQHCIVRRTTIMEPADTCSETNKLCGQPYSLIVVIGAGVIGLSVALRLRQHGYEVAIVARDFPAPFETIDSRSQIDYASAWAGAHNRWIPPANSEEERDHKFALATFCRMEELEIGKKSGEAGVTFMKGIEYLESPSQEYLNLTEETAKDLGILEFRCLEKYELPQGVEWGCEYRTWCVNPMMYCCFLLRQFTVIGGKIHKQSLRDPNEIFAMDQFKSVGIVVNCSGYGFGDEKVFPTRGQLCIAANNCDATVTRQNKDGTWSLSIPRNYDGGTVIGGTRDVADWNPHPNEKLREELLANFRATYPRMLAKGEDFQVIRDVVGRRPTREGGLRLESEPGRQNKTIVHAYGLGGRGYECSWGVAEAVLDLVLAVDTRRRQGG